MKLSAAQEAWLQDLETTDAPQCRAVLQNMDGFCCLGRACVVAEKHGVSVSRNTKGIITGCSLHSQLDVLDWLGLQDPYGAPNTSLVLESLSTYNDQHKLSFKEIAAKIRANPKAYFVQNNQDSVAT